MLLYFIFFLFKSFIVLFPLIRLTFSERCDKMYRRDVHGQLNVDNKPLLRCGYIREDILKPHEDSLKHYKDFVS